ncbi:hypothetical protein AnigIFM59636_002191 [Aspergillus niger]|nr:hypothetical protein AnigIFM59636_002191 [Aspergillus niger]
MALHLLSGKQIIQQPLPDLRVDKIIWNIEQKARQYSESINWKDDIQGYKLEEERLYCGDEHSVVARFNQNLCHTSTLALHGYVKNGIRFGDYKCAKKTEAFTKIPDIVLITRKHNLCVVGEAKTPWMHNIVWEQGRDSTFRNFIGQIANYMHKTQSKYGFLTTYEQTMFFQQVPHPKKKGAWVLCHSPVIHHDTKYEEITEDKSKDPTQYRGKVTLAECFFYFAKKARKGRRVINSMEAMSWVGSDIYKFIDDDSYISFDEEDEESSSGEEDEDSSCEEEAKDSSEEEENGSNKKGASSSQRTTRSVTRRLNTKTSIDTLQADTERMNIKGHSHRYSALEWKDAVTIHFERLQSKWYYTAKGKRVYVDLHQDSDEGDFFVSGGYRYRVKKHQ